MRFKNKLPLGKNLIWTYWCEHLAVLPNSCGMMWGGGRAISSALLIRWTTHWSWRTNPQLFVLEAAEFCKNWGWVSVMVWRRVTNLPSTIFGVVSSMYLFSLLSNTQIRWWGCYLSMALRPSSPAGTQPPAWRLALSGLGAIVPCFHLLTLYLCLFCRLLVRYF